MKKPNQKLKIGFDFDGVIMHNPLRIIRPIMSFLKIKQVVKRRQLVFFHPTNKWQKALWLLAHQSSFFPAKGIKSLRKLVKAGLVEAHLITGRSSFLENDLKRKLKIYGLEDIFHQIHISKNNEQPHLFKQRKIQDLKLDYFIEDNWDIVRHLQNTHSGNKVFWIYNWVDRKINFDQKFQHLEQALDEIIKREKINKKEEE